MRRLCFILLVALPLTQAFSQKWKKWEVQADTLLNRDEFEGALKLYNKVVKSSKLKSRDAYMALYKRAVCYYSLEESEKALADLDIFIKEIPNLYQAHLLRAFAYRDTGNTEKQLASLNDAIDLVPLNPDLIKWRASLYLETEDHRKALEDLSYVESVQNDAETQMYIGYAQYGLGNIDSAMVAMNKAIELDATYLAPYLYAGSFCLEQGNYELALTYVNLALRLDPSNLSALFYKGVALVELDKKEEGCSCLNKAFYAGEDGAADYLKEYCYSSSN